MEKKAQESDNGQGTPSKGTRQISFHGIRSILKNAAFLLLIIFILPRCSTGNDPDTNTLDNNQNSEDVIKILFIGNSLTYTNDIPGLLERLAEKGSKHVFVDEITIPGAPLARHITNSPSLEKIRSQKWDYVILQSDDTTAFPDMYKKEIGVVSTLKDIVLNNHQETKIIYEMVFGLRDGVTLQELNGEIVHYSYQEYMKKIHDGTIYVADSLSLMIAPVGWAWHYVVEAKPETVLFESDKSHPALAGSYLAACVFYVTIFRESVVGIDYHSDLPESLTGYLQYIATSTVLNDLTEWHIPRP